MRLPFADGVEALLADLGPEQATLSRYLFLELLAGRRVRWPVGGSIPGLSAADAHDALAGLLARGTAVLSSDGAEVVGARGLSIEPTQHALRLGGRGLYTLCAVDAVGIPAALGLDASIESACAACGGAVAVEVSGGRPAPRPATVLIWARDVEPGRPLRSHT